MQKQWSWCRKCQGLFFLGNPSDGVCPSGGAHDGSASAHYLMYGEDDRRPNVQTGWRWCRKCQGLAYAGNGAGRCPAGGGHDTTGSWSYVALAQPNVGQTGWRWCNKCQGMFFAGNATGGRCPADGEHNGSFSGAYCMDHIEVVRLDFTPERHGFQFRNDFVNHVSPGITTYGLCGGMSLAVARYWLNHVPIPRQTAADFPDGTPPGVPPVGSQLHSYIYGCQLASYGPLGLISAANWITLPHVTWDNQFDWSVQEFTAVRQRTDQGIPTVLGLRRRVGGPFGHQVLVYGYDANEYRLFVYDPNYVGREKCLRLNFATRRIDYDGENSEEWSSYFVTGCSVEGPPPFG
jgi:hypothetical protein